MADSLTASQFISHDFVKEAEEEHQRQLKGIKAGAEGQLREGAAASVPTPAGAEGWAAALQEVANERHGDISASKEEKKEETKEGEVEREEEKQSTPSRHGQEGQGTAAEKPHSSSRPVAPATTPVVVDLVPSSFSSPPPPSQPPTVLAGRVSSLLSSLPSSSAALPLCLFSLSLVCFGFFLGHRYATARHSQRERLILQQRGRGGGGATLADGVQTIAEVVTGLMRAMTGEQDNQLNRLIGTASHLKW